MKFAINRELGYSQSRALILKREEDYFKRGDLHTVFYSPMLIVKVTCDWDENEMFPIIDDTASIQYRPKSIYRSSSGFYYKNAQKKREYLTPTETSHLLTYMSEVQKYLKL